MADLQRPRNVLIVVIDQLRAECLNLAIGGNLAMPNLNGFKRSATTFNRHYCVTVPCGPSRASLLTGLYAMNHRALRNGTPLRADISNLAIESRKHGYEPLLFGYTDSSGDPRNHHPNDPGIRRYEGVMPGFTEIVEMRMESGSYPWRASLFERGYDLPEYSEFYAPRTFDAQTGPQPQDPSFYKAEDSDTAFLADACLRELAVRSSSSWLALLTFIRPHPPFIAPEPYNRLHDPTKLAQPKRMPTAESEAGVHPFIATGVTDGAIGSTVQGYGNGLDNESERDVNALRAVYYGLASEVDHHIGRIIRFLKEQGMYDNTLIAITSDHGEMLGDRRHWGKQTIFEEAFHVPLLIRDPERSAMHGQEVDEFTESVDLTPTVLDWIGEDWPTAMNGLSLLQHLDGHRPVDWKDCSFAEFDYGEPDKPSRRQRELRIGFREANLAILREHRFKLVHFNGGLPPLLFDMESPEGETRNLAEDSAYSGELLRLTRKMLDHKMRHADHALSDLKVTGEGTVSYRR